MGNFIGIILFKSQLPAAHFYPRPPRIVISWLDCNSQQRHAVLANATARDGKIVRSPVAENRKR